MSAVDLETQFTEWMEQSQHLWNANTRLLAGNYTIDKEVVTKPQHLSLEVYITLTSNFTLGLELSLSSSSFVPFETCNLQFPWRPNNNIRHFLHYYVFMVPTSPALIPV